MRKSANLRSLLKDSRMIVAPGAYDAITARLIEGAGFEAVYMTGAGTSAAFGYPDFGLITMTEMTQTASTIARSVEIPVVADSDTGYGNELNVFRTVRQFEETGVAAIHLEDQEFPKRCGHLDGKRIIPAEDFYSRIRAACAARRSDRFMIIARTDARAVAGFDEAISRANGALAAGADMAFVEAPQSVDEIAQIPQRVKGPCLVNLVAGGKTPIMDFGSLEKMGFKLAILPIVLLSNVIAVCEQTLRDVQKERAYPPPMIERPVAELFGIFNSAEWEALRLRFKGPL